MAHNQQKRYLLLKHLSLLFHSINVVRAGHLKSAQLKSCFYSKPKSANFQDILTMASLIDVLGGVTFDSDSYE